MTLCARDARQRFLIAKRAMANNEIRKRKSARDRLFAELVYRRIFMRTGGVVRTWTTIIAHVKRLRFLVSSVLFNDFETALFTRSHCYKHGRHCASGVVWHSWLTLKRLNVLMDRPFRVSNLWLSPKVFRSHFDPTIFTEVASPSSAGMFATHIFLRAHC